MSWSCPFHSFQLPLHAPVIFHACPGLSLRVSSRHLPSCRLVALSFVRCSFPLHSPCFHFCRFHVPFSSPLFPFHFPLLSCHVDFLFPPLISLHILAFSSVFAKRTSKNTEFFQIFGKRRKSRQGDSAWDPCLATPAPRRLRLVERHQITARYVGEPPSCALRIRRRAGGGLGRGVILYPRLDVRHAEQCRRIYAHVCM